MYALVSELEQKEIMSSSQVERIREYITEKYLNHTSKELAEIFSDTVHKILDKELYLFSKEDQGDIKRNILIEVVNRRELSLNGFDICKAILAVEKESKEEISLLEEWIMDNFQNIKDFEMQKFIEEYISPEKLIIFDEVPEPTITSGLNITTKNKSIKRLIALLSMLTVATFMVIIAITNSIPNYKKANHTIIQRPQNHQIGLYWNYNDSAKLFLRFKINTLDKNNRIDILNNIASKKIYGGNHPALLYKEVSINLLQNWLDKRGSILAREPYLSAILNTAYEYNLNPLLFFAIAGQEQSFVPKKNSNAHIVANNPFNVFGSWEKYNTNIYDSATITARTLISLSKNRPVCEDPIRWINRKYAEDQNWWKGVGKILKDLETNL